MVISINNRTEKLPVEQGKRPVTAAPRLDNSCALGYGQMDDEEREEP
jgi:hypothetical protein